MLVRKLFERFPVLEDLPQERKQQLTRHFQAAPDWILEYLSVVSLPADTVFIREGQPAYTVYMIASGVVKAIDYRFLDVQYDYFEFNDVCSLGGMEVLLGIGQYCTTLKTVAPCLAIQVSRVYFEKWVLSDLEALKYEMRCMGGYLLAQGRLSREYLFLPGAERLAKLLICKYDDHAVGGVLTINSNRQVLANETGLNIKTVNRAIKLLSDEGYIKKFERKISVDHGQYLALKKLIAKIIVPEFEL